MSRILKLTLAYDGAPFVGWQRQPRGVSIQALLEDSLARIEGSPVTVVGAGRTDAGVHALGQVASAAVTAALEAGAIRRALNATLPGEIRVIRVEDADPGFHARYGARAKTYRYHVVNGETISPFDRAYAWHVTAPLDVDAMRAAAACLAGPHDFAAFQAAGGAAATSTRTLHRSAIDAGPHPEWPGARRIVYDVTGDGFLRHMVRAIVGTLVDIGSGRWSADALPAILASRDRGRAGPTAPAHGLFLVGVDY